MTLAPTAVAVPVPTIPAAALRSVADVVVVPSERRSLRSYNATSFARRLAILLVTAAVLLLDHVVIVVAAAAANDADEAARCTFLYATGRNQYGQFGTGSDSIDSVESTPVLVDTYHDDDGSGGGLVPVDIATGHSHSNFVASDGSAWAAGNGREGNLGLADINDRPTFAKVKFDTEFDGWADDDIINVEAGYENTFFVTSSGDVYATGENVAGQLGVGDTQDRLSPVKIGGLRNVKDVAAGSKHTLFLTNDGTVYGAGDNTYGQLCLGDDADASGAPRTSPVQISADVLVSDVEGISAGMEHSVLLTITGDAYACGRNHYNQLGLGDDVDRHAPTRVDDFASSVGVTAVAASLYATTFLLDDGTVYATGRNSNGQLGVGDHVDRNVPVQASVDAVEDVYGSKGHQIFYRRVGDGRIWSCGANAKGQLGVGDAADRHTPAAVSLADDSSVFSVAGGNEFTLLVARGPCPREEVPADMLSEAAGSSVVILMAAVGIAVAALVGVMAYRDNRRRKQQSRLSEVYEEEVQMAPMPIT